MGVGGGERVHPTHMHMHGSMHVHMTSREFPGIPLLGVAICMKLSCLPHMHVRACMCVQCACMWVTCVGGTP